MPDGSISPDLGSKGKQLLEYTAPERDLSKEILHEAIRLVTDERSVVLSYPANRLHPGMDRKDANYENASQVQFVVINSSTGLANRDQTCIAILQNGTGDQKSSFGFELARMLSDRNYPESTREIYITRFTQNAKDIIAQEGTLTALGLSENISDATGRFSLKLHTLRKVKNLNGSNPPNIASRWAEGGAQLLPASILVCLGTDLNFTADDQEEVLDSLKRGRIDSQATEKVLQFEEKVSFARAENRKIQLANSRPSQTIPDKITPN